eukprot:1047012-Prymnesium_polylepis.1
MPLASYSKQVFALVESAVMPAASARVAVFGPCPRPSTHVSLNSVMIRLRYSPGARLRINSSPTLARSVPLIWTRPATGKIVRRAAEMGWSDKTAVRGTVSVMASGVETSYESCCGSV